MLVAWKILTEFTLCRIVSHIFHRYISTGRHCPRKFPTRVLLDSWLKISFSFSGGYWATLRSLFTFLRLFACRFAYAFYTILPVLSARRYPFQPFRLRGWKTWIFTWNPNESTYIEIAGIESTFYRTSWKVIDLRSQPGHRRPSWKLYVPRLLFVHWFLYIERCRQTWRVFLAN